MFFWVITIFQNLILFYSLQYGFRIFLNWSSNFCCLKSHWFLVVATLKLILFLFTFLLLWLFINILFISRYIVLITVWKFLRCPWNTMIIMIVIVRWHFLLRRTLSLIFEVILNIFIFYLSFGLYKKCLHEIFYK